jgi:tetratricopeptide (TPR) repeat protein
MPKKELAKLLARAIENEKKYDWVAAIDFYQRVLENSLQQCNSTRIIVIIEKIGYCFHRAAMQAKSRDEFEKRMKLAIEAYQRARKFYGTFPDSTKAGRESRNQAIEKYLNYWLASSGAEKIKLLNECLEFEEKALTQFDLHGNMLEYCITYNSLWLVFFLRGFLEWDFHVLLQLIQKGIEWGKKAISAMSELDNLYEIAWTNFVYGSCLSFIASVEGIGVAIVETEEAEKNYPKAVAAIEKSLFLSEKLDDALLKGLSHLWLGYHMVNKQRLNVNMRKP